MTKMPLVAIGWKCHAWAVFLMQHMKLLMGWLGHSVAHHVVGQRLGLTSGCPPVECGPCCGLSCLQSSCSPASPSIHSPSGLRLHRRCEDAKTHRGYTPRLGCGKPMTTCLNSKVQKPHWLFCVRMQPVCEPASCTPERP